MKKLKLNFLESETLLPEIGIDSVLHQIGKEIREYARGYFEYIVTSTIVENVTTDATLYIIVPEIGYDYRIIHVSLYDITLVELNYFTLKSQVTESLMVNISDGLGLENLYDSIAELLSTNLSNQTFRFLINQVDAKRESNQKIT